MPMAHCPNQRIPIRTVCDSPVDFSAMYHFGRDERYGCSVEASHCADCQGVCEACYEAEKFGGKCWVRRRGREG